MKIAEIIKKAVIYVVSGLGAAGNALQSYMALVVLINGFMDAGFALSRIGLGVIHSVALAAGGICGGLVNLFINIELLESFLERVTGKKPMPNLTVWQKVQYWGGSSVFILTGILFGLTAFAFGPIGALAGVAIAAGFFVAAIMMIQELETWLESFDNAEENKKSIWQIAKEWYASLTKGKLLGYAVTALNVIGLSLLFTLGLVSFLIGVGVPALPALIAGFVVAFTGGAFTEFYFYNRFLSKFCDNLFGKPENKLTGEPKVIGKLEEFWQSKYSPLGLAVSLINATVFGGTSYVAIMSIGSLLVAASIAVPPLGVIIAIAATVSVFVGVASLMLAMDFWIRNSKRLPDLCCSTTAAVGADSKSIVEKLADGNVVTYTGVPAEEQKVVLESPSIKKDGPDSYEKHYSDEVDLSGFGLNM